MYQEEKRFKLADPLFETIILLNDIQFLSDQVSITLYNNPFSE